MDDFTARLVLRSVLKCKRVLYVEHKRKGRASTGRYYALTAQGLHEITQYVAALLFMTPVKVHNNKKSIGEDCIETNHPDSLVRDVAEEVYGKWNVLEFYTLDNERSY